MEKSHWICGIDEAGRGPLAGPVCAAAVVLASPNPIDGLADSKKLTEKRRLSLSDLIRRMAPAWSIGWASVEEIDRLNIRQANLLAMQRAFAGLKIKPTLVLVDGNDPPILSCEVRAIVGGDALEPSISAASILAKTARDAAMIEIDREFPAYGFAAHKGYGVKSHMDALKAHGPCRHHRSSFRPVREAMG